MNHERFLKLAKKLSFRSNHHTHKLGAVIAKGNKILGTGFNIIGKQCPRSPHEFKAIHAEYLAFLNSDKDISGATVYVFRQHRNGTPAMARPCESCYNFLMKHNVKKIVYSFEGSFKEEKVK